MASEIAKAMGAAFTEMADAGEFFSKLPVTTLVCQGITCDDVSAGGVVTMLLGSASGTMIGNTTDKLAFHGATPVVKRVGAAQAAVADTAATNVGPYGYSQAQADGIVTLLNEIRAALVEKGIIKGAA